MNDEDILGGACPCWPFKAISITSVADFPGLISLQSFFTMHFPHFIQNIKSSFNVSLYGIRKITIFNIEY